MTVGEIISLLTTSQAQGFTRTTLVQLLNWLLQMLTRHECAMMMAHDPDTGLLPLIETTEDQFEYTIDDTFSLWGSDDMMLWRISRILTRKFYDYGAASYEYEYDDSGYKIEPRTNYTHPIDIHGNRYYPYYQVRTYDSHMQAAGTESGPHVTFTRDPGTTTNKFYYQGYFALPNITSERQPILIPGSDGAHLGIIFPCLVKLLEGRNSGNMEEAMQYIYSKRMELWAILQRGAQGKTNWVMPRHA